MKLSLCMICRDNKDTIRPCLESIRPWVDEMVVVDTGSTDATPGIAEELGARLFHFPWCDDFASARNESLRHARGEWIFWMDSDDTIPPHCGQKLRDLAEGHHPATTLGYVIQVHCPGERDGDLTVVDHVKMVRNHPQIRFEFRIHEQVLMSIRRLGGEVGWTDAYVVHSGADRSADGRQRKYERDLRILADELDAHTDHPFVLFNLGMTYADMDDHESAVEFLRKCVEVSGVDESHVRKAYALLVASLDRLNGPDAAYEICLQGLELFPDDVELLFRKGILSHSMGRNDEAERSYLAAIQTRSSQHFASVDPAVASYKARHNLALAYKDMGRPDLAEVQLRNVLGQQPDFEPSRKVLLELLVNCQHVRSAFCSIRNYSELAILNQRLRCVSVR